MLKIGGENRFLKGLLIHHSNSTELSYKPLEADSDPPFTDEENEAQKDGTTGPKTYGKLGVNTGAKLSASKSSTSLASGLIKSPILRNQEKRFRQT